MSWRQRRREGQTAREKEEQAFYSRGVLEGEPMIHGRREEEGRRKSDSPRNLFTATARNSGRKGRVTERGERDRGRRGEGD